MKNHSQLKKEITRGNSITSILVYKYFGGWVFDHPEVGLSKEAFVAGADTLLDKISDGKDKCLITFSHIAFPGHRLKLDYVKGEIESGTDYRCEQLNQDLWLCPALNKYYFKSPENIYIDFKPQD